MRVFVAGATGALGRHLVPGLVAAGHEVTATTRTPGKVAQLREAGAEPVVVDGLDREAVIAAVRAAGPEVIVHQMTALADMRTASAMSTRCSPPPTNCGPGAPTTCWRPRRGRAPAGSSRKAPRASYEHSGGPVKTEEDPLASRPHPVVSAGVGGDQACGGDRAAGGAGGNRAALRRLLRAGRLGGPAGRRAEAAGAGDRRRDRDLVVHRDHRRRGRDARCGRMRRAWRLQRRGQRPGAGRGVAAVPGQRSRARSRRCACPLGSGGCSPESSWWPR